MAEPSSLLSRSTDAPYRSPRAPTCSRPRAASAPASRYFCYHPGLSSPAVCRQCLVEVKGQPKLAPSCYTPVAEGMDVLTESEKVVTARAQMLEFTLVNHPVDCPICDKAGECTLQKMYQEWDGSPSRVDTGKVHKPKVVDLGPEIVLDAERCILCTRCIRVCDEVAKDHQLEMAFRGDREQLTVAPGKRLDNPYSLNTVDVCPVGALTAKDFRFAMRAWELYTTPSVCAGCATGCNDEVHHSHGKIYRLVPRENHGGQPVLDVRRGPLHLQGDRHRTAWPRRASAARPPRWTRRWRSPPSAWPACRASSSAWCSTRRRPTRTTTSWPRSPRRSASPTSIWRGGRPSPSAPTTSCARPTSIPTPPARACSAAPAPRARSSSTPTSSPARCAACGSSAITSRSTTRRWRRCRSSTSSISRRTTTFCPTRCRCSCPRRRGRRCTARSPTPRGIVQRVRAAVEPPGEARPHHELIALIAKRLGVDVGVRTAKAIFAEMKGAVPELADASFGREALPIQLRFAASRG